MKFETNEQQYVLDAESFLYLVNDRFNRGLLRKACAAFQLCCDTVDLNPSAFGDYHDMLDFLADLVSGNAGVMTMRAGTEPVDIIDAQGSGALELHSRHFWDYNFVLASGYHKKIVEMMEDELWDDAVAGVVDAMAEVKGVQAHSFIKTVEALCEHTPTAGITLSQFQIAGYRTDINLEAGRNRLRELAFADDSEIAMQANIVLAESLTVAPSPDLDRERLRCLESAGLLGDALSAFYAGFCWEHGDAGYKDPARALRNYRRASDLGSASAMISIVIMAAADTIPYQDDWQSLLRTARRIDPVVVDSYPPFVSAIIQRPGMDPKVAFAYLAKSVTAVDQIPV